MINIIVAAMPMREATNEKLGDSVRMVGSERKENNHELLNVTSR